MSPYVEVPIANHRRNDVILLRKTVLGTVFAITNIIEPDHPGHFKMNLVNGKSETEVEDTQPVRLWHPAVTAGTCQKDAI